MSGTRRKPGLLGPHVEGYRAWLRQQGYTPATVRNMLKELGQVGRWMETEGLELAALDEEQLALFRSSRRAAGYRRVPGARALMPLLRFLREVGVVPPAAAPGRPH